MDNKLYYTAPDGVKLWTNDLTKRIEDYCNKPNLKNICLKEHKAFIIEYLNGHKEYIIYNGEGKPVCSNICYESLLIFVDLLKVIKND
jgi:hypothetical protein